MKSQIFIYGECRAVDAMKATAAKLEADIILVSEPSYFLCDGLDTRIINIRGKTASMNMGNTLVEDIDTTDLGFS